MKKLLSFLIACLMIFACIGCGGTQNTSSSSLKSSLSSANSSSGASVSNGSGDTSTPAVEDAGSLDYIDVSLGNLTAEQQAKIDDLFYENDRHGVGRPSVYLRRRRGLFLYVWNGKLRY